MAAYNPGFSKWRPLSSQQYLSSSSEEEVYDAEQYDEEEGWEEEECDEEEWWEEEECDEEEWWEEEEYDEEEEWEEEEYDDEEEWEEEYDDECYDEDGEYGEEEDLNLVSFVDNHRPSTWKDIPLGKEVHLVQLPKNCPEYLKIKNKVHSTLSVRIDRIVRIENPYIWGCYMLKKSEFEHLFGSALKELELFHATAQSNIDSIAANNLDWRRTKRGKFGSGVSFSPRAYYANQYCNYSSGTERALILARVLVGKYHTGTYGLKAPNEGYDTTVGNSKLVYVKYDDNEFYPEYVAYYRL